MSRISIWRLRYQARQRAAPTWTSKNTGT